MCDVAYAIISDRVERQTLADRTAFASVALKVGDEKTPWPDTETARDRLDGLLAAPPEPESKPQQLLRMLRGA